MIAKPEQRADKYYDEHKKTERDGKSEFNI